MLWPYDWQATRAAVAGTGGPGNNPYAAAYVGLTNEWQLGEASSGSDFIDFLGNQSLAQVGSPGVSGDGGRTFAFGSAQYGNATANNALAGIGNNFSGSAVWKKSSASGSNETIFGARNRPPDGNLTFLLRYTSAFALQFFIGDGVGGLSSWNVATGFNDQASKHWFAWSFNATTKEVRWSLDGAAVVSQTSTVKPTTLPATPRIGVGGHAGEYFNGTIYRVRMWQTTLVSDTVLRTLDFQDPRGV